MTPERAKQEPAQTGVPDGWRFERNADGSIGIWAPAPKPGESLRTNDCVYPLTSRDLHELLGKLADHQAAQAASSPAPAVQEPEQVVKYRRYLAYHELSGFTIQIIQKWQNSTENFVRWIDEEWIEEQI